jgi:hypothetical protein
MGIPAIHLYAFIIVSTISFYLLPMMYTWIGGVDNTPLKSYTTSAIHLYANNLMAIQITEE